MGEEKGDTEAGSVTRERKCENRGIERQMLAVGGPPPFPLSRTNLCAVNGRMKKQFKGFY